MMYQDSTDRQRQGVGEEDAPLVGSDAGSHRPSSIALPKVNYFWFMGILYTTLFFMTFGGMLIGAPQTRIYESVVCRNWYNANEPDKYTDSFWVPESACKRREIQGEVAIIGGVGGGLMAIPGLLLAYFYAQLADNPRIGRKLVLVLSMVGLILGGIWSFSVCWFYQAIPLRWTWLGSAFSIIGGGLPTMLTAITTMMADVVPPAKRATAFFQVGLASVAAQLLGRPLASALMKKNPWIPFLLGFAIFSFSTGLVLLLPETVLLSAKASTEAEPSIPLEAGESTSEVRASRSVSRYIRKVKGDIWEGTHFLRQHHAIIPIVLTFFIYSLIIKQADLLLLYASAKYGIEIADVGFLTIIGPITDIVLIVAIMPQASKYLMERCKYSDARKDQRLAQISMVPLTLGSLLIGLSPNVPLLAVGMVIFTLGTGFSALNRSLVTSLIEPLHIARLYAIITMISSTGDIFGSPLLAALYDYGLSLSPGLMGLPFYFVAILSAVSGLIMICVKIPAVDPQADAEVLPPPYRDEEPFTDDDAL